MIIQVTKDTELISFLKDNLTQLSIKIIKKLLTTKCIYVNNKVITQYNYLLKRNDEVYILKNIILTKNKKSIEVIYEDKNIIIVNKPHNLLTISTTKEKEHTLYNYVSNYVKKQNKNNKIFIIHRLDKETSGIIMFTKNQKFQKLMQKDWNNQVLKREYLALVHNEVKKAMVLKNYILEKKEAKSIISNKHQGKLAITQLDIIRTKRSKSLLKIRIYTGRKNQIRLQLAYKGFSIIGDKKYGLADGGKRLYLHAYKLEFINPLTGKVMKFKTVYPLDFNI